LKLTQQAAALRDPTDLLIMKPDVHWSQLRRQYRMGLTSEADLVDLRAMDTAEDVKSCQCAIRATLTRNALSEQFLRMVATASSESVAV
jgi:hypothetical protein